MKRILYVGGFELPDKNAAAHRVLSIAKAWRDGGIEVILIGVSRDGCTKCILDTKTDIQGFASYSVPYPKSKKEWAKYLTDISKIQTVIDYYGTIDGVICYNYQAVAFDKLRRLCGCRGIKLYADCTEWYNTNGASLSFKILKGLDTWYRMTVVQKKLDGMIVISDYLREYYQFCKNVIVVPPLVDVEESKWCEEPARLGDGLNFIYAGQPGKKDRIDEIIEAFCGIEMRYACDLWIIGITQSQFLESFPYFAKERLSQTVHFLGRVSHKESLAYLKGADCSLIIRDSNRTNNAGFPTKFVEAATMNVGVIATDISDLQRYAKVIDNVHIVRDGLQNSIEEFINEPRKKGDIPVSVFDYKRWIEELCGFLE